MAYFITDDNTSTGRDPNINIINGIHKIKGRTSVNILVSNYTNKHLTFHKRKYIGHLEPAVIDDTTMDQKETHQTNSITLQKMMAEQVKPDVFNPLCHKLSTNIQNGLNALLKEYESQFMKDETSIGTTPLTSMTIKTGSSDPVSQKPYPIAMKHYQNRKFIKGFAKIAKILMMLTCQQVEFNWTLTHHTAFLNLKEAIIQAPKLCYPDPNKKYIVYTDASDDECGAQLSQEHDGTEFPIAFLSHTFTETQRKWSTNEQEGYGVHYTIT